MAPGIVPGIIVYGRQYNGADFTKQNEKSFFFYQYKEV